MLFWKNMYKTMNEKNVYLIYKVHMKEVHRYENDLSAKEKTEIQSSWIQSKNEYSRRKKSFSCKTCKRKKEIISIGRIYVAFFKHESGCIASTLCFLYKEGRVT